VTVAVSVARFTAAVTTPSARVRAFCTRPTQEAQVIPPISSVHSTALSAAGSVAVLWFRFRWWFRSGLVGVVTVIAVLRFMSGWSHKWCGVGQEARW
jgi:hypothetical protein